MYKVLKRTCFAIVLPIRFFVSSKRLLKIPNKGVINLCERNLKTTKTNSVKQTKKVRVKRASQF